jgi:hypothetical protein
VSGDALGIVHHAHYSPTPPTIAPAHRRGLPTRAVSNCRATPQTPHEPPRRAQARDAQRAATPLQGDDLQAGATRVRRRSSALLAVHGSRTHRRAPCIARERAPVAERIHNRTLLGLFRPSRSALSASHVPKACEQSARSGTTVSKIDRSRSHFRGLLLGFRSSGLSAAGRPG